MGHRSRKRAPRGMSLIEVMVAMALMLVAVLGLLAGLREAMNSNASAHRRTEATMLRTGLMERLSVTRRATIDAFAGTGWVAESCYDADTNRVGVNTAFAADFVCPAGTVYVRHVSATAVPSATGADQRVWSVPVYVDRIDRPCTPATRYSGVTCVGADLYLTD